MIAELWTDHLADESWGMIVGMCTLPPDEEIPVLTSATFPAKQKLPRFECIGDGDMSEIVRGLCYLIMELEKCFTCGIQVLMKEIIVKYVLSTF